MANSADVKNELERLFDQMAKKGILKGADKKELVNIVMDSIEKAGTMSKLDLKNPALIKTLSVALTGALALKMDPKSELKLDLLFKDGLNPKEKNEVKKILTTANKMLPKEDQLSDKELDKVLDDITQKKNTANDNNNKSLESDDTNNLDATALFLQMLLNTPNPYQTTGQQIVVQREVDNNTGIVDQNMTLDQDALSNDSKIGNRNEGKNLPQEHEQSTQEAQEEQTHKPRSPFDIKPPSPYKT